MHCDSLSRRWPPCISALFGVGIIPVSTHNGWLRANFVPSYSSHLDVDLHGQQQDRSGTASLPRALPCLVQSWFYGDGEIFQLGTMHVRCRLTEAGTSDFSQHPAAEARGKSFKISLLIGRDGVKGLTVESPHASSTHLHG